MAFKDTLYKINMRQPCYICGKMFSDNTRGRDCASEYCLNKDICDCCSTRLYLYENNICIDCINNRSPTTLLQYYYQLFINLFR